jgi:hypothetical protein
MANAALAADAPSLDPLQGRWSTTRTNRQGEPMFQVIEIKKDKLTFQLQNQDKQTRFVAKGTVKLEKAGPFQVMNLTDVEAGRSADDLQQVNESRAFVYMLSDDKLYLASGFDQARENEPPRADPYVREAKPSAATGAAALAGSWKLQATVGETTREYELRLAHAEGKLEGTMVSPRSGEHKIRLVTFKDDQLLMEWDREMENNPYTLLFQGKLSGDALAGTVAIKGNEDMKGSWKAAK